MIGWKGQSLKFARFLGVGVLATAVHLGGFVLFYEWLSISALAANFFAFAVAVVVSFIGHFAWTFREETRKLKLHRAFPEFKKFILTALIGLLLNSTIAWVIVDLAGYDYRLALLPMGLAVPIVTFLLNQNWVFTRR